MKSLHKKYVPFSHDDERGIFQELFNIKEWSTAFPNGIQQVSRSISTKNVFRGFHFQFDPPMPKIMRVTQGAAIVYSLDIRPHSPTFGIIDVTTLEENNGLLYADAGIARAFYTIEDKTVMEYLQGAPHDPRFSVTITILDELYRGAAHKNMIISDKDRNGMSLEEWRVFAIKNNIFTDYRG